MTAGESLPEMPDDGPLTPVELTAIQLLGRLHQLVSEEIIADGPAKWVDAAELTTKVHDLQYFIMSQAASRSYPRWFRLLGEGMPENEDAEDTGDSEDDQ